MKKVNVAVFAHNEQENIVRCIDSVIGSVADANMIQITVLINGSTDRTSAIVESHYGESAKVRVVDLEKGDKANAWNHFVYSEDISSEEAYYFLDGDNWLPAYALDKLENEFDTNKYWAIAPTPIGISESLRDMLINHDFISGNCYGVSGHFLKELVSCGIKIPVGFIGDDSFVMYLLQEGFSGFGFDASSPKSVKVVTTTGAVVPRLRVSLGLLNFMHSRYKRYALRHMQQEVLYFLGRQGRLSEMPSDVTQFKAVLKEIGPALMFNWVGLQSLYHPFAYFKLTGL